MFYVDENEQKTMSNILFINRELLKRKWTMQNLMFSYISKRKFCVFRDNQFDYFYRHGTMVCFYFSFVNVSLIYSIKQKFLLIGTMHLNQQNYRKPINIKVWMIHISTANGYAGRCAELTLPEDWIISEELDPTVCKFVEENK